MAAIVTREAGIASMDVHDDKLNFGGWRRVLVPFREAGEAAEVGRTLKERCLIGAVFVGLFVLTPAWIALVGWLFLRLALWLIGA
jgi:hypothetical protein